MKLLDWLLSGDITINQLVKRDLLDESIVFFDEGIIKEFLMRFDPVKNMWGGGIYGPKWISTTYTLLDVIYLGANRTNEIVKQAATNAIRSLWPHSGPYKNKRYLDMCIAGMLVTFASYASVEEAKLYELIDYILLHAFPDGGWNCCFDSPYHTPKSSSLHTTINVLEGLYQYERCGFTYRIDQIKTQVDKAKEFILEKQLFRSVRTKEVIHPDMAEIHFPYRWKYDCFRALEYFARSNSTHDERMNEALDLIKSNINTHPMPKGNPISGLTHFKLETTRYSRFNTYRACLILKKYEPTYYQEVLLRDYIIK